MIEDICVNEILGGFKKFDLDSIVSEYPDEFVRKMRMTGLISFRGGGLIYRPLTIMKMIR